MIIKEISKGISHIEDVPIMEFISTVYDLHQFDITEKLDGAQILFGIDENGFYTSRETKGGNRIYEEQVYGLEFSTTYMRSAHKLLEEVLPTLRSAGLKLGDQVEAEVLYGELPNVVPYSADTNYLIFLRTTEGAVNIDRLKQKLDGQSLPITLLAPYTPDGRFIELREETNTWEFSRAPQISTDISAIQMKVMPNLRKLSRYLGENSGVNGFANLTILDLALNKRPEWCEASNWKLMKSIIKEKREEINITLQERFIPGIKDVLLNNLVRNRKSEFGPLLEDGGWIEGVVLKHGVSGRTLKLVDKDIFGIIRENAWKDRNLLTEAARSVDGEHSFLAGMYISLARSIGHPELGTMQAKNYLRKIGTITEDSISNLSADMNFEGVKEYWLKLLEQKEEHLLMRLNQYEKEKDSPEIHKGIQERTLQSFATVFEKIYTLQDATLRATKPEDFTQILVEKHINNL